ncbi:Icc-related predicted phosphoesterase [Methanomicrobium sp. W14]|uniref:metallophosphoesterase family protein n=1 Tax=Methanomicrobium sp. W14 TaxID=2817839 RepID=UPI001AE9C7E8|nr:metallophosphoesterase [Methanomicrobium sp. W14]MBP2132998.1 Icc-related predicted phosphoesterase [Methanomicrobium sp. W14]
MINVLLLTDLHGQYGKMGSFLDLGPDMVLISGDLTEMGPCETVIPLLDEINVPCFAIPGNCDPKEILDTIEKSEAVCLHGSSIDIGEVTLVGVGGANPTPFCTPFEIDEKEIDNLLTNAESRAKQNVHNILLCHAPPYGVLDDVGGNSVGSRSIKDHMNKYDLVCCGHIHDQSGIKEVDGTIVVNPGPASEGRCAMITLGDEPKDIKVDLKKV